ncbi:MAG: HIT domain-containing protein [Patescibacteria group bacterium]
MQNCIFCKIVKKEIPANIVYEDENFIGFLDIHPHTPGHVQVIPKKHYRWVWDMPIDKKVSPNLGSYFETVAKIAHAQQKAFNTDWVLSKIVGDEIPHAHIWVFPNSEVKDDKNDFEGNKKKIIESLK